MDFENLHQILRSLYDEMMPLCSDMTDIAKGLAGLGALFYVALRVWQSLSRAEPIDVFPLLRPFAIDHRARYAQQRDESHRARYTFHAGDTDLRHE